MKLPGAQADFIGQPENAKLGKAEGGAHDGIDIDNGQALR